MRNRATSTPVFWDTWDTLSLQKSAFEHYHGTRLPRREISRKIVV